MDAPTPPDASLPIDSSVPIADAAIDAAPDAELGDSLLIETAGGRLQGRLEGSTRVFSNIPYAAPPLGPLRFAPPMPALPWTGIRDATANGPMCPQVNAAGPSSEDCLTLNIYAPESADSAPVMVFIHGGGFATGDSSYPAQYLSHAGDTIVVLIQYRVGALGHLVHPALDAELGVPSGNLSMRDQQRALEWVRDNIQAFGGDAANVTLFGQSAGGVYICLHTVASGSRSLAQRFIMQSGSCAPGPNAPWSREEVMASSETIASQVCPGATDPLTCLRDAPVSALVPANALEALTVQWRPYIDGTLITDRPLQLMRSPDFHAPPTLLGYNHDDYAFFQKHGFPVAANLFELDVLIALMYPDHAAELSAQYMPQTDDEANAAWMRLRTDEFFRCPAQRQARATAQSGSTYVYSFDVQPAVHALELDYVFGWPSGGISENWAQAPFPTLATVVHAAQTYWTSFARTGDPNSADLLTWPRYELNQQALMRITDPLSVNADADSESCAIWETIWPD